MARIVASPAVFVRIRPMKMALRPLIYVDVVVPPTAITAKDKLLTKSAEIAVGSTA